MHAFLAYFDTFFTPSGASHDGPVSLERFDETLKIDGRPGDKNDVSFTTGPKGVPTHWKQTLFILNKPIDVTTGAYLSLPLLLGECQVLTLLIFDRRPPPSPLLRLDHSGNVQPQEVQDQLSRARRRDPLAHRQGRRVGRGR